MIDSGQGEHNLILKNRKKLVVSGVTDVDNFDENSIFLYTELGELLIRGKKLHINVMNVETGELSVEGDVNAVIYGDKDRNKKANLLGKLFR